MDVDFTLGLNMLSCLWYCVDRAECVAAILNGDRCCGKDSYMASTLSIHTSNCHHGHTP